MAMTTPDRLLQHVAAGHVLSDGQLLRLKEIATGSHSLPPAPSTSQSHAGTAVPVPFSRPLEVADYCRDQLAALRIQLASGVADPELYPHLAPRVVDFSQTWGSTADAPRDVHGVPREMLRTSAVLLPSPSISRAALEQLGTKPVASDLPPSALHGLPARSARPRSRRPGARPRGYRISSETRSAPAWSLASRWEVRQPCPCHSCALSGSLHRMPRLARCSAALTAPCGLHVAQLSADVDLYQPDENPGPGAYDLTKY